MYVTKNLFIGGKNGVKRLENLQALADKYYGGNFARMVNHRLDQDYNLDPETGAPRTGKRKCCDCAGCKALEKQCC